MGRAVQRAASRVEKRNRNRKEAASHLPTEGATLDSFAVPALAIFSIALAVRLIHVWQLRRAPFFTLLMGDSKGYDEWAQRIAGGEWIGHDVFYQAPLYPYFLGVVYSLLGRSLLLVRVVQAFIGSFSCVLIALAARRFFSHRVGLVAGLMLALYAPAIFFDGLIQKSVLDVFFVCLMIWLVSIAALPAFPAFPARAVSASLPALIWFAMGLAVGGLGLTRENALVFVVVIALWSLARRVVDFKVRLKETAIFLAGLALVIAPVAIRNHVIDRGGGGFYVTTSQFGPNLYIGNNARADGSYQSLRYGRGAPEYERQDATELAERAEGRRLTPSEVSSYWTNRAIGFISERPGAWLTLMAKKFALIWNRTEMVDTEDQASHADWSLPLRVLGPIGNFGILVPLALFGVIVTWSGRSKLAVLYAMLTAYAASVIVFYVFARYRFPMVPFLILFGATGLTSLLELLRSRRLELSRHAIAALPSAAPVLTAVVVVAIFVNWPIVSSASMKAVTENNLGAAFQSEHQIDEALEHYQRATELRPDYAPAYSNMGTALHEKGRLAEAASSAEHALQLQPDFPDAHYNLANVLLDQGKNDQAVAQFRQALGSIGDSADIHNNLGIALSNEGTWAEAASEFRAALVIDPNSAKAHRNLGDALAAMNAQAEAVEQLKQAAALDPNDGDAQYDLGSIYLEGNQLPEATEAFRTAIRRNPASAEAHNNLGIALARQDHLDEAIHEFQEALKVQPGFADAQRNLDMALGATRPGRAGRGMSGAVTKTRLPAPNTGR